MPLIPCSECVYARDRSRPNWPFECHRRSPTASSDGTAIFLVISAPTAIIGCGDGEHKSNKPKALDVNTLQKVAHAAVLYIHKRAECETFDVTTPQGQTALVEASEALQQADDNLCQILREIA